MRTENRPDKLAKLPIIGFGKLDEKEEKKLREIREYEFQNLEEPGLMLSFPYGNAKNKANIKLIPGGKYKLPVFLARYIESKAVPVWKWVPDGSGRMMKKAEGKKQRFQLREVI